MPAPMPDMYEHWQDWARAAMLWMGEGSTDIVAAGEGTSGIDPRPEHPIEIPPPVTVPSPYWPMWNDGLWIYQGNNLGQPPVANDIVFIDTQNIADAAIELQNMGPNAVGSAQIIDLAVVTAKIGDAAILSAKIADLQVITAKIADLAVNNAKIANLSVDSAKITDLAVTNAKIDNLAVTMGKIDYLAVGSAQIVDLAVLSAKIALLAVGTAHIQNAAITNALIANLAVGTAQIQDLAVGNAKIQDASITSAKILELIVTKLTAGTLNAVIDVGTGMLKFTIGGNMLAIGRGFGTASQFIMWFGPSMDPATCSENPSIFYLKTNGNAFFGGELIAGALHTSMQTSSLLPTAVVDTGTYGSNGGTIAVTLSYSSYCEQSYQYPATSQGVQAYNNAVAAAGAQPDGAGGHVGTKAVAGNVTVQLQREVNQEGLGNAAQLQLHGGTETFEGYPPQIADVAPGAAFITRSWGGSITYTDPQNVAQTRRYVGTIIQRDAIVMGLAQNQRQSVSISSVEQ